MSLPSAVIGATDKEKRDMRKLINKPDEFVHDVLEAIMIAHPDELRCVGEEHNGLIRADMPAVGKVGIVTGGGSGHLPLFLGYVGAGLCSGVAVGNVFASPSSEVMLDVTRAVNGGAGVLYLFGNYSGDKLNFALAGDLADAEDIATSMVLMSDDVASAPHERRIARRGVAGLVFAYKCAGAAAARGDSLDEVTRVAQKVADSTGSMGVGLAPAVLPATGHPSFTLDDGSMEIGIGIHGEPGVERVPLDTADEVGQRLTTAITEDLGLNSACQVAVLVNGLGATPLEELYLVYASARRTLEARGIRVCRTFIGEYATSLEMAGASVTIMRLDDELTGLLDAPASSPFIKDWRGMAK
jgi:dihydroxyacetone kinase